jgi:hypothetical protein
MADSKSKNTVRLIEGQGVMSSLWENNRMRVWKIEGQLVDVKMGAREPEGLNYSFYSAFRPNAKQRGTMFGAPQFGENYNTFHGAIRYEALTFLTRHGKQVLIEDVLAIDKFQEFIYLTNWCTLYLLSGKMPGETNLLFALETESDQLEDLDGIGSMGEKFMTSIQRQLKFVAMPTAFSIVVFCAIILPMFASFFGGIAYVAFGLICAFLIPLAVFGITVIKKKLKLFPSKAILKSILQQEGFSLQTFPTNGSRPNEYH